MIYNEEIFDLCKKAGVVSVKIDIDALAKLLCITNQGAWNIARKGTDKHQYVKKLEALAKEGETNENA